MFVRVIWSLYCNDTEANLIQQWVALPHSLNTKVFYIVPVRERNWAAQIFIEHAEDGIFPDAGGEGGAIRALNLVTSVCLPVMQLPLVVKGIDCCVAGHVILTSVHIQ